MEIDCEKAQRIRDEVQDLADTINTFYMILCEGELPPEFTEFPLSDRYRMLKSATKIVAMLDLNIAAYPITESAVLLFDSAGNPIP